MADSYNEDDDLQRFRQWLRQNGLALVMGVGAGLGAILAWQGWNVYVDDRARGAAEEYTQLRDVLSGGELGAQGALLYAERLVAAERYDDALAQLQWVTSYADQAGLRHIARVRRARLLWAQDQREEALALLEHDHPEAFESLYGELAGDIHAAGGDYAAAQIAYRRALEYLPADADPAPLQRKLDNVAIVGDAATGEAA
jgi:predicted negative regulator of RcsB-dependent stress response